MVSALAHRGPDGSDIYTSKHVGLAHTRLAIIDIEGGKQPMTSHDNQCVITFNGEIYNYRNLRNKLTARGCVFKTKSDTEVILHLYQQYGWEGFNSLRGMFAFSIWDKKRNIGLLVRDPIGIKPLFIKSMPDNSLVFGSEAKAILAYDPTVEIDPSSMHLLLNFRYLPGEISMFKNINQVAPGDVLIWDTAGKKTTYKLKADYINKNENLLELLSEAVDIHCTSDVEVGCYLSGGIDSATICKLAKNTGRKLRSFTVDVGDDLNEAENAAKTAELLDIENIYQTIPSKIDNLNHLIRHLEVPKINAYQASALAKHASKYVKVVLSGLGADEIFFGYNAHRIFNRTHQVNRYMPSYLSSAVAKIGNLMAQNTLNIQWTEPQRALQMLAASRNWPRVYGLLRNIWDSPSMRAQVYGPRLLDSQLPNAFTTLESMWPNHNDPIKSMAEFEWKNKMVNDLLWQEDRLSMAEGLEVRVPFLDIKFSNTVNSFDRKVLMPNGKPKGYMKNMLKGVLPNQVLNRKKSGFQVNAPVFVKTNLKYLIEEWLTDERINYYGLFNPEFVHTILKQKATKSLRWHYFMIYQMLLSHIFVAEFKRFN